MSNKGFASLTKTKLKSVGSKGGKMAQLRGTGYKLDLQSSKAASAKSAAVRRSRAARNAALILLEAGLTPEQLDILQLSEDEFIHYGGLKRTKRGFAELLDRLAVLIDSPIIVNENINV